MTRLLTIVFLAAIVTANLLTAAYGPAVSYINAALFIGLDLTTRDVLHDAWGRHRWRNMALLIAAGGALSYALNANAGTVALASCLAFTAAATIDALVYAALRHREWLSRSNVSNVAGAAIDSLVFPTIAFGGVLWGVTAGQFAAKVAGGVVFSLLLRRIKDRTQPKTSCVTA